MATRFENNIKRVHKDMTREEAAADYNLFEGVSDPDRGCNACGGKLGKAPTPVRGVGAVCNACTPPMANRERAFALARTITKRWGLPNEIGDAPELAGLLENGKWNVYGSNLGRNGEKPIASIPASGNDDADHATLKRILEDMNVATANFFF